MSTSLMAFDTIVEQYLDYVYTLAYRVLGNREDAQDAVQETFCKLHRHFNKYDKEKNLKNWICTIALNCARDIYRCRKSQQGSVILDEVHADPDAHSETGAINKLWAIEMLATLSFNYRTVMVMFYIQRMPVKEIAKVLKRPEVLIKVWLHRARTMLCEKFGDMHA